MKRFFNSIAMLFIVAFVISCSENNSSVKPSDEAKGEHAIILSIDGFRWDYVDAANTPTLDSLRRVGTYAQVIPVFPANTFAVHYAEATGLHPNNNNVVNNSFYDKELGRNMSVFDADDCNTEGFWGGEPIWNSVELQGGKAHIYMWPGSEYEIQGRQASVWTKYDGSMSYYTRADKVVEAMSLPESEVPDLVMWYFDEPDGVGHHEGPLSEECIAEVERIDQVLAYFFEKIRSTPYYDDINFIITSDHGMGETSPEKYINIYPLLDNSKVKRVTYGQPYGVEVEEEYLEEAVEKLRAAGLRAYSRFEMPEKYHYGSHPTRIANIVIIPEMGWKIDYREKDGKAYHGGSHGYDPFESDMQVIFYGSGPDFKSNYTHTQFQNQNIYEILCYLTHTTPAENDGVWEDVVGMFR